MAKQCQFMPSIGSGTVATWKSEEKYHKTLLIINHIFLQSLGLRLTIPPQGTIGTISFEMEQRKIQCLGYAHLESAIKDQWFRKLIGYTV